MNRLLLKKIYSWRLSFETSIGAVVYYKGPHGVRYLLLQYPHGHWDFVKGHTEKGESEQETLLREVQEETNISENKLTVRGGFRERVRFSYRAKGTEYEKRVQKGNGIFVVKQVFYYAVESKQTAISISDEHIGHAWLPHKEALKRVTFENSKNILQKAHHIVSVL